MWNLGSLTLKRPSRYVRRNAEVSETIDTLDGQTKKDLTRLKFIHELGFSMLTVSQVNELRAEYEKNESLDFSINDGDYSISTRKVIMRLSDIQHNSKGSDFRADVTITLAEV